MDYQSILAKLPYSEPFLFVDELLEVNDNGVHGVFTFKEDLDFYSGHFTGFPVTPGVILTECCAQIGLVCLGIYLLADTADKGSMALSSSEMDFYEAVYPGDRVEVSSEKIYFRFGKLKCRVTMRNAANKVICKGIISGMFKMTADEN